MNALIVLLVIICLIIGVVWVIRRDRTPAHRHKQTPRMTGDTGADTPAKPGGLNKLENNPLFWGVEVAQAGCEAAQALLGRQYTFDEAPQLPLEGCSSAMCTCQFKGLRDHRTQHRRKSGERRVEVRFDKDKPDRRSRKDRRRGNKWNDRSY
ncbi:MAG: hypothetical protein ABFS22_12125 [Pseudomonadota bacterium]